MSMQGFRGNCDSKGKLGMCPSLAEPDSGGFPRTSRRQLKSFLIQQFFKNVGEVWASSPHLRSKSFLRLVTIMSRRQRKVFCSSNFSKMLARCGRAAHICEANETAQ